MTIAKQIQAQRNRKCKNLRKLRKARDMASVVRRKKEAWTTSKVLAAFAFRHMDDLFALPLDELAVMIYNTMAKRRPAPPSIPVTAKK